MQGHEVVLATLDRGTGTQDLGAVRHAAFPQAIFPRKLGRSPTMRAWLHGAQAEGLQIIHSHGLWMMPNMYPASAARRANIPHVLAPRGTLDPAALVYSRWVKKAAWHLRQKAVVKAADVLHATSEIEATHIRAAGLRQPIILSPNGIDVPGGLRPPREARRILLYLGRLHEKKGLDMLLAAWAALEPVFPDWDLRIVGTGAKTFEAGVRRDIALRRLERVRLTGPAYSADKLRAYRAADLFVLPTRGENFGMVVAEALAAGTPVVTTTGAPWEGLVSRKAGWWCAPETGAIEAALTEAMATAPHVLEDMGVRGRAWMQESFGWEGIGARLCDCYRWLLSGCEKPEMILTD